MDALDKQIKDYFQREINRLPVKDRAAAPSTGDFYAFLTDTLEGEVLRNFLDYLKRHPETQETIRRARELMDGEREAETEQVPAAWVREAKNLFSKGPEARCPHCGKTITPFKKPIGRQNLYNGIWLAASAASFAASFYYHRYFYQFLAMALFFGIKWILDRRATRTQILIYKSLQEDKLSTESKGDRLERHWYGKNRDGGI